LVNCEFEKLNVRHVYVLLHGSDSLNCFFES